MGEVKATETKRGVRLSAVGRALRRTPRRTVLRSGCAYAGTEDVCTGYPGNDSSPAATGNANLRGCISAPKSVVSPPGEPGGRRNGSRSLRASALIEAVVASTVFLIVFMLSLDTVSRITTGKGDDEYVLIDADHRAEMCFARYGDGSYPPGTYEEEFPWGKVVTEIVRYGEYGRLQEVTVRAVIDDSRRGFTYKYIVEAGDGAFN